MNVEISSRNDTKAQHSISIYPIPIPNIPLSEAGLTEAKNAENGTGNYSESV